MNKLLRFFRNGTKTLKRERFFALVNVLGLSLGMFCFLVTSLYVRDELITDRWHKNADRIFSPMSTVTYDGIGQVSLLPDYSFAVFAAEGIAGIEASASFSTPAEQAYEFNGERFKVDEFYTAEPSMFDVFDFELKYGNEETALNDPKSLIISEELVRKHFGEGANPIGQTLKLAKRGEHVITGVMAKPVKTSHMQFDMIVPIIPPKKGDTDNKMSFGGLHYFLLSDNYTLDQLEADTELLVEGHEDFGEISYYFNKFSDMYLNGTTWVGHETVFGGNKQYLYIFSLVGVLMLVVACFNYINLTTARSISRSKDMAVRKIVGASKLQIIWLQVGETAFLALFALIIASISVELTLPEINMILEKELSLNFISDPGLLLIPAGLVLLVVVISGIYPAVIASSFSLSTILKGSNPRSRGAVFRKVLVVMQFLICAGLLSSALIIRGQADYLVNLDAGYNRTNVVNIDLHAKKMDNKYKELKAEFARIPQIEMISGSALPHVNSLSIVPVGEGEEARQELIYFSGADRDIIDFFEIELVQGQNLTELEESELEQAILINETAVEKLGYENPIGQRPSGPEGSKVVGVIKDFQFTSAKSKIGPFMISYSANSMQNVHVKFREGDREIVLAQMKEVWEQFNSVEPFEAIDVATYFDKDYRRESTLVSIFDMLTGLLALIAFLGLFALSTFENKLKEKEMSIRKVLGASYMSLISIMNRRFLMLIVIALAASVPITWYLIKDWLSAFPYRIDNTLWQFVASSMGVVLLTVIVLSTHGYRNAKKNPTDILRNE